MAIEQPAKCYSTGPRLPRNRGQSLAATARTPRLRCGRDRHRTAERPPGWPPSPSRLPTAVAAIRRTRR